MKRKPRQPKARDSVFKLTLHRRQVLAHALFDAYYRGWDGKDMDPRNGRPYIDKGFGGSTDVRTAAHFRKVKLAAPLSRGRTIWYLYLTPLGIKLAREVYADDLGQDPQEAAEAALASERKYSDELERKVKRASRLLRGLKVRQFSGLKPEALSTMMVHRRVRDGFKIDLNLDQLIELGEQIEKLR